MTERSTEATVLVSVHDVSDVEFESWFEELAARIAVAPGHLRTLSAELAQRAVALMFDTEESLHGWIQHLGRRVEDGCRKRHPAGVQ